MAYPGVPGLTLTVEDPPSEPAPLRTDVAGLIGRARRGPVLRAERVVGWSGFQLRFGGLEAGLDTTYAARGYFDNGGDAARVVRVTGQATATASAGLVLGQLDPGGNWVGAPAGADFAAARYVAEATSPGAWANGTELLLRYRSHGVTGEPEVDVRIKAPGEQVERFARVRPSALAATLAGSLFVRLRAIAGDREPVAAAGAAGPRSRLWRVVLAEGGIPGGGDAPPTIVDYLAAVRVLQESSEPALLAAPDLHADLSPDDAGEVLALLLQTSADARDRLLLVDLPQDSASTSSAVEWIDGLRARHEPSRCRSAAVYHPRLRVPDPLGGRARPLRDVPPSGHVAGVISRLDRERGAGHSPANAAIYEAVDVSAGFGGPAQASLTAAGINVLRCSAGGGLEVWGARTTDLDAAGRFVAHRRLLHLLVRAIRRVAQPLVFENHDAGLRLTFTRSITSVLLQSYNAGALKGARPDEAFRVQCDDANNPPEHRDLGRLVCDIQVAPAAPMEFISIRLALSAGGLLDVVEA
jgi:hypothetical protein